MDAAYDALFFLMLPMILFLAMITSYEDIKKRRIRNMWILLSLSYAALVYFFLVFFGFVSDADPSSYFFELISTSIFALVLGFLIWHFGFWTAGDAKLFAAYSALMPLSVYSYGYIPYFASANIFINTFAVLFIAFSTELLFKTTARQKLHYMKETLKPRIILRFFVLIYSISWAIGIATKTMGFALDPFFQILIVIILTISLERYFHDKFMLAVVFIAVLRLVIDENAMMPGLIFAVMLVEVLILLFRSFVLFVGFDLYTKQVDLHLVEEKMVSAERIYMQDGEYKKEATMFGNLFSKAPKDTDRKVVVDVSPEGLCAEEVRKIRKISKKVPFEHLRIYKTISFAPYLAAGVLLTIIFRGNFFIGAGKIVIFLAAYLA